MDTFAVFQIHKEFHAFVDKIRLIVLENMIMLMRLLLGFIILLLPAQQIAAKEGGIKSKAFIKEIKYVSEDFFTRVEVTFEGDISYSTHKLRDPDRLFFDFQSTDLSDSIKPVSVVNDGILHSIRIGQHAEDVVRIVFDLESMDNYKVSGGLGSFVLDIYGITKSLHPERAVVKVKEKTSKPVPVPVKVPRLRSVLKVVIDAGHGGRDSGATGWNGLKEKDIALDIARRLKKTLEARQGISVILTRDSDIYLPLSRRTEIANNEDADLFISVHVNAAKNRKLSGIETWFLNATNNKEWQEVATRENIIANNDAGEFSELDIILKDLSRFHKIEESMSLAHFVHDSTVRFLKKSYINLHDHGVKWAKFHVLVGARMPAALLEVGFISNPDDETRLSSSKYRAEVSEAISAGVLDYISSSKTALFWLEQRRLAASK